MIPKVIHYCWFGKAEKSTLIKECMATWKKHLSDFQWKEWNEENAVIDCDFASDAFKKKKWAFVSDYIRLKVLYESGGIYLDTDMFLVKPLHDLLHHSCFLGRQDEALINACIVGCVPGHPFINKCIEEYTMTKFDEHRLINVSIPNLVTRLYSLHLTGYARDVKIYSPDYFYPYSTFDNVADKDFMKYIKPTSYCAHLWNSSWFSKKEIAGFCLGRKEYMKALMLIAGYVLENPSFVFKIPENVLRHLKRSFTNAA